MKLQTQKQIAGWLIFLWIITSLLIVIDAFITHQIIWIYAIIFENGLQISAVCLLFSERKKYWIYWRWAGFSIFIALIHVTLFLWAGISEAWFFIIFVPVTLHGFTIVFITNYRAGIKEIELKEKIKISSDTNNRDNTTA